MTHQQQTDLRRRKLGLKRSFHHCEDLPSFIAQRGASAVELDRHNDDGDDDAPRPKRRRALSDAASLPWSPPTPPPRGARLISPATSAGTVRDPPSAPSSPSPLGCARLSPARLLSPAANPATAALERVLRKEEACQLSTSFEEWPEPAGTASPCRIEDFPCPWPTTDPHPPRRRTLAAVAASPSLSGGGGPPFGLLPLTDGALRPPPSAAAAPALSSKPAPPGETAALRQVMDALSRCQVRR